MADKGDVHFVITADDQASGVLEKFKEHTDKVAGEFVSIGHQFSQFDVDVDDAVASVESLWDVIHNPTPLAALTAGLGLAGLAFVQLKKLAADAKVEFDSWNIAVDKLRGSWEAIAGLQASNDLFGIDPWEKAKAEFVAKQAAEPIPGLNEDELALREKYKRWTDPDAFGVDPQLQDMARQGLEDLAAKEAALREQAIKNRKIAADRFAEEINTQKALTNDAKEQLEIDKQKEELAKKRMAAERELLDLMNKISQQAKQDAEVRQKANERAIKSRADAVRESVLTPKERNNREAYEAGVMAMFGDISPETYGRVLANQGKGGSPAAAGSSAGYVPNSAVESRNLTRGGGESFDPQLAELKRQSNLAQEQKDQTAQLAVAIEKFLIAQAAVPQLAVLNN